MAKAGSQRDADDSVDGLITEAASLYGYANLKDEEKKVLKSFVEGKGVFVAPFNSLACFSWTDSLSVSLKHDLHTYPSLNFCTSSCDLLATTQSNR